MKSVLLHAGPHKTGTTYLQACFRHFRGALRARGIAVPAAWEHSAGNASHSRLVAALGDATRLPHIQAVFDEARDAGCETLLISAEDLSSPGVEKLQALRRLAGDCEITVVFYVRRWSDVLPSAWQEMIKQGYALSFPEFLVTHVRNPNASQIFNLNVRLASLIEVFGQNNIRLVSYSTLRDAGDDLFVHFAGNFLGWHDATPPEAGFETNESRGPLQTELIRRLNMLEFQRTGLRSPALRGRFDSMAPTLDTSALYGEMKTSQSTLLFDDGFLALRQLHQSLNGKFGGNMVSPAPKGLLFQPARRDIPYVGEEYLLRPGVLESLRALHALVAGSAR